jgi:hypothetical protein
MRKIIGTLAAVGLATGVVTAVVAPAAQAAGTYQGCPYGAVCVYPQNAGWNNGQPSLVFWSYGAHKLSNQVGNHYVFNNQSGGATSWVCKGSNGTDCPAGNNAYTWAEYNLTPINSIKLVA